ncbi:hypothetical protein [Synechococcus sp. CBW1108]|uniref:hypothetical protein n=1 Tax=Synechococcus sp. CBW1108 TaxID=1353147 RepID=UPI0018CD407E|nr:hypothetical protein [Synechococcus sp. CBW1108]QPN71519.1 hypothetical protein H8F27_08275 [Synechococcus sp. CBW1108]
MSAQGSSHLSQCHIQGLFGAAGAEFQLPEGSFEGYRFREGAHFGFSVAVGIRHSRLTEKLPE